MRSRRPAWRLAARSDELTVKLFESYSQGEVVLELGAVDESLNAEQKLSRLCRWVLMAEAAQVRYALSLPELRIDFGLGAEQRDRCLTALALHGRS